MHRYSYKLRGEDFVALHSDSQSLLLMTNIVRRFIAKILFYILFFPWHTVQTKEPLTSLLARFQQQRSLQKLADDRGLAVHHYNRNVFFLSLTEGGIVPVAEMTLLFELYCLLL